MYFMLLYKYGFLLNKMKYFLIKNRRDIEHYMDLSTNSDISQKGDNNTAISGSGNAVGRSG